MKNRVSANERSRKRSNGSLSSANAEIRIPIRGNCNGCAERRARKCPLHCETDKGRAPAPEGGTKGGWGWVREGAGGKSWALMFARPPPPVPAFQKSPCKPRPTTKRATRASFYELRPHHGTFRRTSPFVLSGTNPQVLPPTLHVNGRTSTAPSNV